jgi:1,4-dihydroxy-2-naphthoate octaprenyltransferase
VNSAAWAGAVATGLIADALLMANNVRDIPTDRIAGKRTLAVRLGDRAARIAYPVMLAVAVFAALVLAPANPWMLLALVLVPAALVPSRTMLSGAGGPALIPVLQQTGFINLGFALLFTVASVLGKR